jgi:peptidoglycan/LPS O-acetylase OafA/YrhL
MHDYRLDVWRIIAVSFVIIHHLFPVDFPNAYIGVDVFIVIAGFLTVQTYNKTGRWRPYIRDRALRVYPELLVLLIICILLSLLLLSNQRLKDVSSTVVASIFSLSNILFSIKSDYRYGQADSAANPLLHLWSLGLEMQFYLIAPFLVRFLKSPALWKVVLTICILIGSFSLTLLNSQGTYYLLTARLWEFLIGVLAAVAIVNYPVQLHRYVPVYFFATLSIIFIGFSNFGLYEKYLVQCLTAATVGAALYLSTPLFSSGKVGSDVLRRLGYETYSIYLAHYPAIVFGATISLIFELNFAITFLLFFALILLLTLVGGEWLRKHWSQAPVYCTSALFVLGLFFWFKPHTRPWLAFDNFDPGAITKAGEDGRLDGVCNTVDSSAKILGCTYGRGRIRVALIGDSFGAALMSGFDDKLYGEKYKIYQFTKNGCPFSTKIYTMPDRLCVDFNESLLDNIQAIRPDIIVVNYRWWSYSYRKSDYNTKGARGYIYCLSYNCSTDALQFGFDQNMIKEYYASVSSLSTLAPRVVLISPTPEHEDVIPNVVALIKSYRSGNETNIDLPIRKFVRNASLEIFQNMSAIPKVEGVYLYDLFSTHEDKFHAFKNGEVLYYDSNHLSSAGARLVWQRLEKILSSDYPVTMPVSAY